MLLERRARKFWEHDNKRNMLEQEGTAKPREKSGQVNRAKAVIHSAPSHA